MTGFGVLLVRLLFFMLAVILSGDRGGWLTFVHEDYSGLFMVLNHLLQNRSSINPAPHLVPAIFGYRYVG